LDNDGLADEIIDNPGDVDCRPIREGDDKPPDVACLPPEVDFVVQVVPDLVDDPQRLIAPQARHHAHRASRQQFERLHVALDLALDPGTADLDDDLASVMKPGGVDLSDRGRRERRVVEVREEFGDRFAQIALDFPDSLFGRKGRNVVLKRLKLLDVIVGQEIPAQAQGLADLDEGRAKPRSRCEGRSRERERWRRSTIAAAAKRIVSERIKNRRNTGSAVLSPPECAESALKHLARYGATASRCNRRRRSALVTTETELSDIARAAMTGLRRMPNTG
jgi:hypothetical protein